MISFTANTNGEETPKTAATSWDFVTLPEEDRAMAIGNTHKKFGKDRACGSGDILADRQTHRQTCSSQYFATAPAGEVIIIATVTAIMNCRCKVGHALD